MNIPLSADEAATQGQSWSSLPVLDLRDWTNGNEQAKKRFADEVVKTCKTAGFFYVTGHGIPQQTIDKVYSASQDFHDQGLEFKSKYHIASSRHHRGWVPTSEVGEFEKDGDRHKVFYESFDLSFEISADDARAHKGYGLVGPNVWPDLADFRSKVTHYYDSVYSLGRTLLSVFERGLGMSPKTLLRNVTAPPSQLRLLKYFANDAPSDRLHHGIDAHSDFECFTILHATQPGLQLLSAEDHWVETPPIENCFTILIGDCLEAWTGGDIKATQHRVVNHGAERFSLPFFFSADYDCEIKPQAPFDTVTGIDAYPAFKAGEHLWGRTITVFPYLRKLVDQGQLQVDFEIKEESPFKRLSKEEKALSENKLLT